MEQANAERTVVDLRRLQARMGKTPRGIGAMGYSILNFAVNREAVIQTSEGFMHACIDRDTAKIVAFNLQKLARQQGNESQP
jgi:hypothetical protein